jgi:YD repeat-containing protein
MLELLALVVAFAACTAAVQADTMGATDGRTPPGMAPGSPVGSYLLSDFESVDLFSGNLNFALPLHRVAGRGEAGYAITLGIKRQWTARKHPDPVNPELFTLSVHPTLWEMGGGPDDVGYGAGLAVVRQVVELQVEEPPCQVDLESGRYYGTTNWSMTRLSFMGPDGTEHSLEAGGKSRTCCTDHGCEWPNPQRGDFSSTDGSQMAFRLDADTPIRDLVIGQGPPGYDSANNTVDVNGFLWLGDGTAYRIEGGRVAWIRDRNGNLVAFEYPQTPLDPTASPNRIVDSLGRETAIQPSSAVCPGEEILFGGFEGATRIVRVCRADLADVLAAGETLSTYGQLFPDVGPLFPETVFNPRVASGVHLPDGREYTFRYTAYGRLARVELPTGGAIEYEYGPRDSFDHMKLSLAQPIASRRLYREGGALEQVTTYSYELGSVNTTTTVITKDGNGRTLRHSRHSFHGRRDTITNPLDGTYGTNGKEFRTETLDGAHTARTEDRTWLVRAAGTVLLDEQTTLDGAPVVHKVHGYDSFNNRTSSTEYDLVGGAVRRRCASFVGNAAYVDPPIHLITLPKREAVYDGTGGDLDCATPGKTWTTYEYDGSDLVDRPAISGHDSAYDAGHTTRGNVTRIERWGDVDGNVVTLREYDVAGNVVAGRDGRGSWTAFSYEDRWGIQYPAGAGSGSSTFAYATGVTNRLGHKSYTRYDFETGLPVQQQDPNGVSTELAHDDPLDRPTRTIRAANVDAEKSRTTFQYEDAARRITTRSDLSDFGDGRLTTVGHYDGLGRVVRTEQSEDDGVITVEREYDGLGRLHRLSNPYRSWQDEWTTTDYDALSRVRVVTTPDGAQTVTSYDGSATTVTDPAAKVRTSVADGFGRVVRVIEDSAADAPCSSEKATCYAYDVLDNLVQVRQGGQTRGFLYDSLSQLRTAQNPESGTVTYGPYDGNGNLRRRSDARGVVTDYDYDLLDRIRVRSYTGDAAFAEPVSFEYDSSAGFGVGRLTRVVTGMATRSIDVYDASGRVVAQTQTTNGQNYPTSTQYNRAGLPVIQVYPTGRIVQTSYDAAGRVQGVTGLGADGTTPMVFAVPGSVRYAPHGGVRAMRLGSGRWDNATYNSRLQPQMVGVGGSEGDTGVMRLEYGYGATDNNGNVREQWIVAGGGVRHQRYDYDERNRLRWLAESLDGTPVWGQTFGYDRFGNRWVDPATSFIPPSSRGLTPASANDFEAATNRIITAGTEYDPAGNQTRDAVGRGFDYDAENRLVSFSVTGRRVEYAYDGEGRRVIKQDSSGTTSVYVYDAEGRLLTEHSNEDLERPATDFIYAGPRLIGEVKGWLGNVTPPPSQDVRIFPKEGDWFYEWQSFQWKRSGAATYRFVLRTPQGDVLENEIAADDACPPGSDRCARTAAQLGRNLIGTVHYWNLIPQGGILYPDWKFYVGQTMPPSSACMGADKGCGEVCQAGYSPCDAPCRVDWDGMPRAPTQCGDSQVQAHYGTCNADYTCALTCDWALGRVCAESCVPGETTSIGRTWDCGFNECCADPNPTFNCSYFAGSNEWTCAPSPPACPSGFDPRAPTSDCEMCCVSNMGPSCVHLGGEICSQTFSCPDGHHSIGQTATCRACCDRHAEDSCIWELGGECHAGGCRPGYVPLGDGVTSDCEACCTNTSDPVLPGLGSCSGADQWCSSFCAAQGPTGPPCDAPCMLDYPVQIQVTCGSYLSTVPGGFCNSNTSCDPCNGFGTCAASCPPGTVDLGRRIDCQFQKCCGS